MERSHIARTRSDVFPFTLRSLARGPYSESHSLVAQSSRKSTSSIVTLELAIFVSFFWSQFFFL